MSDILIRLGTVAGAIVGTVLLVFGTIWFDEWSLRPGRLNRWARIVVVGPFAAIYVVLNVLAVLTIVAMIAWYVVSVAIWVATGHWLSR
jgi:hypothetical protein